MHEPNPAPEPSIDEPDYTKVRGWLLFMGILAGWGFVGGIAGMIRGLLEGHEYLNSMTSPARQVQIFIIGLSFITPFIALAQCVLIFQRKRLARKVSLALYGLNIGSMLLTIFFLDALMDPYTAKLPPAVASAAKFGASLGMLVGLGLDRRETAL